MSEPIVRLVNFTPMPIETMLFAYKNMHGQLPNSLGELAQTVSPELKRDFMNYIAVESLAGGVQEFVNMVWLFKNVSRAFQQQLTRHRQASYAIQSLRIVPKEYFATDDQYHTPSNVKYEETYRNAMLAIEKEYEAMLADGEVTEVARGILPLNIYSPITMNISLRSLIGLVSARLCHMAQGEFQVVARLMVEEVTVKMGKEFAVLFHEPCYVSGVCPHADGCGWRPKQSSAEGANSQLMKNWVKL